MATYADPNVANSINQAVAAGMSESTVESQHVKAVNVLTATPAQSAVHGAALTAAIALLNMNLAHIRDPRNH